MRRFIKLAAVLTIAVLAVTATAAQAAKPDKPGGGKPGGGKSTGQNGGGVIYYSYHGDIYTMNDDGSGVEVVSGLPAGFGGWGQPSFQLHAEKRWFVQDYEVPGEFYPDFDSDGELKDFANRRVFYALSDSRDAVELSIPADLEPLGGKWTIDDGYVSFPGRRWGIDPEDTATYGSVLEGGLYRTAVNFESMTGDITGAGATELAFPLSLVPSNAYRQSNETTPGPDMGRFDWAPDGKRFVFDAIAREELRIGNIDNADPGEFEVLFSDPDRNVSNPLWSPAGDQIMFNHFTGWNEVDSINPDGSGLQKLVGSSPNWTYGTGVWSPTGSHLLFQYFDHFLSDSHIVRANATGGQRTRLTGEEIGDFSGPRAIGWREAPAAASGAFASVPEPSTATILLVGLGMLRIRVRPLLISSCVLVSSIGGGFVAAHDCAAGNYRFTNIATTTDGYTRFGAPSINDLGVVAFGARTDDARELIQTWDAGDLFTLYDEAKFSSFSIVNWHAKINNAGTVAFLGGVNDSAGFFTGDGGPLANIANADSGPLSGATFSLGISLNNSGSVAFGATLNDGGQGIFVGDGGPVTTIARANAGSNDRYYSPALNDFGEVAYVMDRGAPIPSDHGFVFYDDGTRRTTLLESPNVGLGEAVVMNNLGQVVVLSNPYPFLGPDPDAISTLSIVSSEGVTLLADSSGSYDRFSAVFNVPGINDHGDVAFHAQLDSGQRGIFTGPDPAADSVIVAGDTLFGVPVEDISFWGALSESGQIAFSYTSITGIRGIALATAILDVPGDTNGDGVVDAEDLNNVRNFFGTMGPDDGTLAGDAYPFDGLVNIDDLNAVRNHFGAGGAAAPEPAAGGLLIFGAMPFLLTRRGADHNRRMMEGFLA